jgi:AcrR family transcriptional regulator
MSAPPAPDGKDGARNLRPIRQATIALPHRERLLLAGDALMVEYGNFDFGVRQVVERAQVSLRTFYQYFETRDDFALAVYAELIRQHAMAIGRTMPKAARATRFHHFVRAVVCPSEWGRLIEEYRDEAVQRARALVREGFHLRETRPEGYKVAIAPLCELLTGIVGSGAGDIGRNVTVVLNSLITETYDVIFNSLEAEAVAEHLFRYHKRGLRI